MMHSLSAVTGSIRNQLLAALGVIALIATGLNVTDLASAWQTRGDALETQRDNRITAHLLDMAGNLAVERGATVGGLNAARAVGADVRGTIDQRRQAVAEASNAGFEALRARGMTDREQRLLRNVESALEELNRMRRQADDELRLTMGRRTPGIGHEFFLAISALIERSSELRMQIGVGNAQGDDVLLN